MNSLLDDLKNEIARGQTLVIIGDGVSIGATNRNKCASWTGLLHNGVDRCADLKRRAWVSPAGLHSWIDFGDMDLLLTVVETIYRKLGAPDDGEYRRWLRETVGALKAENKEVIHALSDLGAVLATTNYDGLIEEVTGLPPITWKDSAKVERVLRGDEKGVLHLYGYWENPQSVILGIHSYEQILVNNHAQRMQRAVAALKSILFVGCGERRIDPNFESLMEWTGKIFAGSEYRRFRLALDGEREKLQQQHPNQQRLFVLSYGQRHDDLAGFLRGLKPESKSAEPLRLTRQAYQKLSPQAPPSVRPPTTIFISYRRQDSGDVTGRIYDRLVQHFGGEAIFKDVDTIPLGVDFRKFLGDAVGRCGLFLAVIGQQWLNNQDNSGARRLDNPRDFVRVEIEAALQRDIPVIPLLVQGATVPSENDLPLSLQSLVYRNAISIRPDPDFHRDVDRLIKGIELHLKNIL